MKNQKRSSNDRKNYEPSKRHDKYVKTYNSDKRATIYQTEKKKRKLHLSEELSKAVRLLKNKMLIYFVLVSARLKSNYYDIELMFLDKESVLCNLLRTIRSFESGSGIISKKKQKPSGWY